MSTSPSIIEFQQTILDFYNTKGRVFPWRETLDPYAIMVSEIMLQQTQTERVVPKYIEWMQKFPTVEHLSKASLVDVLSMWSGLGYNRRARFLHNAAIEITQIIKEDGKSFPSNPKELEKLPGIGHYTARAVSTFAFNNPEVFIETNIRSVFLFFFFQDRLKDTENKEPIHDSEIFPFIEKSLFNENPRMWYYALMDYGAELKKIIKNPNRKSKHYTKQSRFEGSIRQARGAILRQLTMQESRLGLCLESISKAENLPYERLLKASELLCKEKMIYKDGDLYIIL